MTGPLYLKNEERLTHPQAARLQHVRDRLSALFLRLLDLLRLLHNK